MTSSQISSSESPANGSKSAWVAVFVAALGYFVDVYDIVLFSVVRIPSLRSLGFEGAELLSNGVLLLNMQMIGMLLGGVLWGIWGDKVGRISVLFGSILLYSVANILNAGVSSIESYALLRFIAGVGLAGELGAGVTLVAESLPQSKRGIGTTLVATVGVAGAVVAGLVGDLLPWRTAYLVGGGMGFALLGLRIAVHESGMFRASLEKPVKRGDLRLLFVSRERLGRFLSCVAIGLPVWFVVGILVTFSPELSSALGYPEVPSVGRAIIFCYVGLVLGDLVSGLLCQYFKSRRKVLGIFLSITAVSSTWLLMLRNSDLQTYYVSIAICGFGVGYWAVFITSAAEQFGTNMRATVTTIVPNAVRGAVVPMTTCFEVLKPVVGVVQSAALVGIITLAVAFYALQSLQESFHKDLDFLEE